MVSLRIPFRGRSGRGQHEAFVLDVVSRKLDQVRLELVHPADIVDGEDRPVEVASLDAPVQWLRSGEVILMASRVEIEDGVLVTARLDDSEELTALWLYRTDTDVAESSAFWLGSMVKKRVAFEGVRVSSMGQFNLPALGGRMWILAGVGVLLVVGYLYFSFWG